MSEIVRPTRDGIHGREYISTAVDIGRKLPFLALDESRGMAKLPPLVSIPMPLIIDLSSPAHTLPQLDAFIEQTAAATDLIAILDARHQPATEKHLHHIAFYLGPNSAPVPTDVLRKTRLVEIGDSPAVAERIKGLKKIQPEIVIAVRVELTATGVGRASEKGTWVRILQPHVEGKLVRGSQGLDVGDHVRVELVDTAVERGFIDFHRVSG